ncbi:DUF4292 domain-containing protein [Bacteroidota bacterium]
MKTTINCFLIVLISLTFFYPGCVPSKPTEDVEILPSERLINRLEANRRKIRNFEGTGILEIKSAQFDNSANFRIVMQKPDSIYLTIFGPFGIELAQALVTSNNYFFYDALENTVYEGDVTDDILNEIFKINLSFNDLLDAFVGSVNLSANLYKQPDDYQVETDNYVLTYSDSSKELTSVYKVDIRELGITNYILNSFDGSINIEGKYFDFELIENVSVPFSIVIQNKLSEQKLTIDYRNIIANRKGLVIDFNIPDDATVISW